MRTSHNAGSPGYDEADMDHNKIPIEAVSARTRKLLNEKLCDLKQLVSPENYQRDYRGLCDLMEVKAPTHLNCEDLMQKLFQAWRKNQMRSKTDVSVGTFLTYLELIDRFDVYDDCMESIEEDCILYLNAPLGSHGTVVDEPSAITIEDVRSLDMGYGLPHYDAILLYDDADIDWADQIYSKLTSYGFSVCNKDNSFVVNGSFEHEAFTQLINRSVSVIVLFSPEFLQNRLLSSLINYAQANNIASKVGSLTIPIFVSNVKMDLSKMGFMQHRVKLRVNQFMSNMDQFWDRLYFSVKGTRQHPSGRALALGNTSEMSLAQTPPRYSSLHLSKEVTPQQSNTLNLDTKIILNQVNTQNVANQTFLNQVNPQKQENSQAVSEKTQSSSSTSEDLNNLSDTRQLVSGKKPAMFMSGALRGVSRVVSKYTRKSKKKTEPLLS